MAQNFNRPYTEAALKRTIANFAALGIKLPESIATRIQNCSDPETAYNLMLGAFSVGIAAWGHAADEIGSDVQECVTIYIESAMDDMDSWVEVKR